MVAQLSTVLLFGMALICSMCKSAGIYVITPDNQQSILGISLFSIISRKYDSDWVFLYFNSSNARQQSTFEYLIPGIAKQLSYAAESKKQNAFSYPPIGVVDCYTCASLCTDVGYDDLPLLIYKDKGKSAIRYRGYVSLAGMISFIKSHDPATSYLAEFYKAEGITINQYDLPKKQIKKIFNKITQSAKIISSPQTQENLNPSKSETKQQAKKQQQTLSQDEIENKTMQTSQQNKTEEQKIEQSKYESKLQTEEQKVTYNSAMKQQETDRKQRVQNVEKSETEKSQAEKSETENNKENSKKKKSDKKSKKTKEKKNSKDQSGQFIQSVEYLSGAVVSAFEAVGFGGILLEIIGWISYVFFFVIMGILCIAVQFA